MDEHDSDGGLAQDLLMVARQGLSRRQALRWMAGAALVPLVPAACGGDDKVGATDTDASDDTASGDTGAPDGTGETAIKSCEVIPEETAGPFPGDGSNGPNVLTESGIVRSDIRTSIGSASGTAAGVPLTIRLTLVDSGQSCARLSGHAVYLWHCTRDGRYTLYTLATENYLRGVQESDADGVVTFRTIFPGCYPGRWPHAHFEVYASLAAATSAGSKLATSQLALPEAACVEAYATAGYEDSVRYLAATSLTSDGVFRDGADLQLTTISGNATDGYLAELVVTV